MSINTVPSNYNNVMMGASGPSNEFYYDFKTLIEEIEKDPDVNIVFIGNFLTNLGISEIYCENTNKIIAVNDLYVLLSTFKHYLKDLTFFKSELGLSHDFMSKIIFNDNIFSHDERVNLFTMSPALANELIMAKLNNLHKIKKR